MISAQTTGLVVEALESLIGKYEVPSARIKNQDKRAFSTQEIEAQVALVAQMRTSLLPALQQQLADLLISLDVTDMRKDPNPDPLDTLEILLKISYSLDQITAIVNYISPPPPTPYQVSCEFDRNYGILKRFRLGDLLQKFYAFVPDVICQLFRHYAQFVQGWQFSKSRSIYSRNESDLFQHRKKMIETTALSHDTINDIIKGSQESDFGYLQAEWQSQLDQLDSILETLARRTNWATDSRKRELFMAAPSETSGDSQAEPALDEHADDQSEASSTENPPAITQHNTAIRAAESSFLLLDVVDWLRSNIPIIKIIRTFLKKLLNTPISKTPFTINGQMSSAEINNVRDEVRSLSSSIEIAVESLFEFYDFNSMEDQMIQFVRGLMQGLTGHFDEAIILLGFYLVPTAPRLDPTSSENFFKDLFLATRQQFRVAMSHHDRARYTFTENVRANR
ncbi:hypothetical protein PSTG_05025 [Puccinia striiformis f. sp. tritici PST-78]|uniref:Uncharacterized protein n=1 Tax=Puccinia striiformis f. sp. tritici PST-78 TaxID=1165861 RepID=A0A0L0VRG8_9BASI|nr:hypothetical protein PSTG_05025 [Puccinia striiformis f. sp. tritici PST-78]